MLLTRSSFKDFSKFASLCRLKVDGSNLGHPETFMFICVSECRDKSSGIRLLLIHTTSIFGKRTGITLITCSLYGRSTRHWMDFPIFSLSLKALYQLCQQTLHEMGLEEKIAQLRRKEDGISLSLI